MDNDLHQRIESLEEVCRQTLEAVNGLRTDFEEFRAEQREANKKFEEFTVEQREENKKTHALLRQFGVRVGGVEGRMGVVEQRLQAVEETVFSED